MWKKLYLVSALPLNLAAFSQAQVRMDILLPDKATGKFQKVGSGKFQQSFDAAGSVKTNLQMQIPSMGAAVSVDTVDLKNGFPSIRNYHEKTMSEDKIVSMTFSSTSVKVTVTSNGKKTVKNIAIPAGKSLLSPSAFWFSRDIPKPGAVEKSIRLDENTLQWKDQTIKYVGDETILVKGTKVKAHKLVSQDPVTAKGQPPRISTIYLDAKGLPYKIQEPSITFLRA